MSSHHKHEVCTRKIMFLTLVVVSYLLIGLTECEYVQPNTQCEYFNAEDCPSSDKPDERCREGTKCDPAQDRKAYCMVQWTNHSGLVQVQRRGCWGEDDRCVGRSSCYEDRVNPETYFCCCEGNQCNYGNNFTYRPTKNITVAEQQLDEMVRCEHYDKHDCENGHPEKCNMTVEVCERPGEGKQVHCYAFMENISSVMTVTKKGCWLHHDMCMKSSCVANIAESPYYCCCSGSMCNVDIQLELVEPTPTPKGDIKESQGKNQLAMTLFYSLVPIFCIAVAVAISFWLWRRHKAPFHEPLPTVDPSPIPPPSPVLPLRPIQLLEVKARGRFGCVWKAKMGNEIIAVKIFPLQDRQSYITEKEIYQLPHLTPHDNILRFIGGEKRGENLNMELWLLTEFHERGSLYDYLKGNLVSWTEALKMAEGITGGLAFLHDAISSYKMSNYKPTVVHRDFKSKNVLIKNNLTACIADYGLAMKFEPGKHVGDTHGQVGTRRYMAPEVLEGSINFSSDHFMRIDMYACGLVLWEIISRCSAIDGPVEEYQLPFEDEVGQHPSLEDMQEVVSQKKKRPPIREHWLMHEGMFSLCQSIQECWDSDPEARLSAGCIQERISQLAQSNVTTSPGNQLQAVLTTNSPTPPKDSSDLDSTLALAV